MLKFSLFIFVILFNILSSSLIAQNETTDSANYKLQEVIVTATRTEKLVSKVAGNCEIISKNEIQNSSVNNIDDLLKSAGSVYVNRSWGIFSKNSSVTMRGLNSSSRTLVMLDGIPMNKLSGGAVNWHAINPDDIGKIEIVKGPVSALYGGNAMGGTINMISSEPDKKASGSIKIFYGDHNTIGTSLNLSGKDSPINGFFWNISAFTRKGDGYIFIPEESITQYDKPLYLTEYGLNGKLGYKFKKGSKVSFNYHHYNELRGSGDSFFEKDGSYEKIITGIYTLNYTSKIGKFNSTLGAFLYSEKYFNQDESMNNFNEYRLLFRDVLKNDYGINWTVSGKFNEKNTITTGFEIRNGDVNSDEDYKTSTDFINYHGNLSLYGLFVQDDFEISQKFNLVAGLRVDYARFYNGSLFVTEPSSVTGYEGDVNKKFHESNWFAYSPKLALKYSISEHLSSYISYSTGFMPPKLDDLCKSGKINRGFKLANPDLLPEKLKNFEVGANYNLNKLSTKTSVYYSIGTDFQYFAKTGEVIVAANGEEKPIFIRKNISEISIKGAEIELKYNLHKHIQVKASYSYNKPTITKYNGNDSLNDLTGNTLLEVPSDMFFGGFSYLNEKIINFDISYNYISAQWADDENTIELEPYGLVNIRISKDIKKRFNFYIDIQNLFNKIYVDRKGQLPPGRFSMLGIKVNF
ncbi:MAG: hypothetical protein A2046_05280 [Bacteroidetes bacterium GWA2_30_7]|nr:MAG: hypothetical protein A2046_05280 [Bacteroidetes bacterium GWA2_30_7]